MAEQAQPDLDDLTPYQMTLAAMVFPWWGHATFNVLGAVGLWALGAPRLAIASVIALTAADWALQRVYRSWTATSADAESAAGLRRLSSTVCLRSLLWFVGPLAHVMLAPNASSLAFVAVTAMSLAALGVSLGWTSALMFLAMVGPAVAAAALATIWVVGLAPAVGVLIGFASFAATLALIAVGTRKTVSGWSQANRRTIEAMAQMRAALARSEAVERRLRVAIDITDLHVYEVDYRGRELVSLGAESAFYEQPLSYAQMWRDPWFAVAPEDLERVKAEWARYEAGEAPYKTEYRLNRNDGREVWAFAAAEITRDEHGAPMSLVGAMHEVTHRKLSERKLIEALSHAEEGSRAKSEFLTTISHEIRTPLNGVLGMVQAMTRDELSAAQRERAEVIRSSGQSLLVLLNSVLDLSKIEAGKFELDQGEIDMAHLVQGVADTFGADAAEKGVSLTVCVAPGARGLYAGDPARVRQIAYNLISNAVKFTPEGSITVKLRRRQDRLSLAVADTGIGMSKPQMSAVFDKFVQADATVTRRFGGSGLGLTICNEFVAKMGGEISVRSAEGRGSTFTVSLPLPKLKHVYSASEPESAAEPAERLDAPPLRLLAAEDNPVNQLVLRTLLEQVGLSPVIVSDGAEAFAAWRNGEWDLILMDIQMPSVDGVSATRSIRSEEAASGRNRTPIVALTANVMAHQVAAYLAAGMDDVVAKPIEIGRLIEAMEACLNSGDEGDQATSTHAAA